MASQIIESLADRLDDKQTYTYNTTLDLVKYIMAVLVIGIHTEPFGFNFWLDKGFGIFTRLCVPFFFLASGYLFWIKDKNAYSYLKRIFILYVLWSIVYLPFDFNWLCSASFADIIKRYCWLGNEHALWYLCGTIIGFFLTYLLLKIFKPQKVFLIAVVFLFIGCLKSTWSPLVQFLFSVELNDWFGSRNGLFYAFPYVALGMLVAKSCRLGKEISLKQSLFGFGFSTIFLIVESLVLVIHFKTHSTILWMSVLPMTYFFFCAVLQINLRINKNISVMLRKMSTLVYVSQYLFIPFISNFLTTYMLFFVVVLVSTAFAYLIIRLSEKRCCSFLKLLY